jgi:hypothetical protein
MLCVLRASDALYITSISFAMPELASANTTAHPAATITRACRRRKDNVMCKQLNSLQADDLFAAVNTGPSLSGQDTN